MRTESLIADITTLDVDAVVNAANSKLLGSSGVDGAIHRAGGSEILKACEEIRRTTHKKGLPTGEAVITTAGKMPSRFVIHTVGPIHNILKDQSALLEACYINALRLADEHKCKSVAFPAISTGIYGYPKDEAARISFDAVKKAEEGLNHIERVIFVFHDKEHHNLFLEVTGFEKVDS